MYRERPSGVPGVVLWRSAARAGETHVLPDGCMDLIRHGDGLLVAGPDTCARFSDLGARQPLTAVRFEPGIGARFFGVDASELRNRRVALDDLWSARRVRELVYDAEQDPVRALVTAVRTALPDDPDPMFFLARALASGVPVSGAASILGWNERKLHRRATRAYGYGPKTLARVLRFRRAVAQTRAGKKPSAVAADCGYSDQSHLLRETRALAGVSLRDLAVPQAGSAANTSME